MNKTNDLLVAVITDIAAAFRNLDANDSQFNRRTLVRTFFALVECLSHGMKQAALHLGEQWKTEFTAAEYAMLKDETYGLDHRGDTFVQSKFLRTDENLRFAIKMFAKNFSHELAIDYNAPGWQSFKQALLIRHRITHPKFGDSIDVNDKDVEMVKEAAQWFASALGRGFIHMMLSVMISHQDAKAREIFGADEKLREAITKLTQDSSLVSFELSRDFGKLLDATPS